MMIQQRKTVESYFFTLLDWLRRASVASPFGLAMTPKRSSASLRALTKQS
ncbi:MAG: hypothetical protein LBP63_01400 [Prevotellaceae bacterium]|nr:hypothetical protein [Prevotellaceae bacterium]